MEAAPTLPVRLVAGLLSTCAIAVAVAAGNAFLQAARGAGPIVDGPSSADDWATAPVGVLALLVASGILLLSSVTGTLAHAIGRGRLLPALLGVALSFVLARDLTYDSYYGAGVRYIENGPVSPVWLAFVLAWACASVFTARRVHAGAGLLLAAGTLFVCTVSAIFIQAGH